MYEQDDQQRALVSQPTTAMMRAESSKAIEEVRSALVIAKQFPRDETIAEQKIINACNRYSLALMAIYRYPKGGKAVEGPTIRLLEVIAQYWGNLSSGFRVLEMREESASVEAFAHDLENNLRHSKTFDVDFRIKANNKIKLVTDPREIYELIANYATRRLRECLRAVIPRYVTDRAKELCQATLERGDKTAPPFPDRVKNLVIGFKELGVSKEMIEKKLGHPTDLITPKQFVELIAVFNAIRGGDTSRESYFEFSQADRNTVTSSLNEKLGINLKKEEV